MTQKVIKDIQMGDVRSSVTVPSVVKYVATSVKIGNVEEGDTPSVTNVGTEQDAILDFVFAKGAYKTAQDGGYTGTQEEFNQDLANFKELSEQAQQGAQTATEKASQAAQSADQAQAAQLSAAQSAQTATDKAAEAAQSAKEASEAAQNLSNATETTYGITRIATNEEALAGTNNEAFITPLKAKNVLNTHSSLKNNPHSVTKAQVGLGNVDNTSDTKKPISGPQQAALNLKADKTYVDNKLSTKADLVDGKVPESQLPEQATNAVKRTGDTMTGALKIPTADLSVADTTAINREWAEKKEQTRITNCITKIPQDIKLELSTEGTLTLKAGSKVYDGAGNVVNITSDKTTTSSTNGKSFALLTSSGATLATIEVNRCTSGETDSMAGQTFHAWYDTTNKVVNYYGANGSVVSNTRTLPIALITVADGKITSIDQVFNGFGYIGSTRFILPGIELLCPNGRNPDGSLNNSKIINSAIDVYSFSGKTTTYIFKGRGRNSYQPYFVQNEKPKTNGVWYSPAENIMRLSTDGANWTQIVQTIVGTVTTGAGGAVTEFSTRPTFRAVDYNDFTQLADNVYKRNTVYSSEGSNATITFETPIAVQNGRYLEVVYTARRKTYTSVIPSVFAPLSIVVGQVNRGGQNADLDYDCVMNITVSGGYITAFTSLGRDIYIKRVDVVDYYVRS